MQITSYFGNTNLVNLVNIVNWEYKKLRRFLSWCSGFTEKWYMYAKVTTR